MPMGQLTPMEFVVNRAIAANENVDSSTATRAAMIGSLLGEGIVGALIARQLASRDAAPAAAPVQRSQPKPESDAKTIDQLSQDVKTWLQTVSESEIKARQEAQATLDAAIEGERERNEALRELCKEIGGLVDDGYNGEQAQSPAARARKGQAKGGEVAG